MSGNSEEDDNCLGFCSILFSPILNVSSCTTIQYNTIQYNTIQYNTIQYNTIQCTGLRLWCLSCMKRHLQQCVHTYVRTKGKSLYTVAVSYNHLGSAPITAVAGTHHLYSTVVIVRNRTVRWVMTQLMKAVQCKARQCEPQT